jgi:hypothetical protein
MRLGATPQPNQRGRKRFMNTKNHIAALIATVMLALAGHAHAAKETAPADAPAAKSPTSQQSKMATCNKDAGEKALKGAERKKFMSECLSAKKAVK